jgi:hypothetical protein
MKAAILEVVVQVEVMEVAVREVGADPVGVALAATVHK